MPSRPTAQPACSLSGQRDQGGVWFYMIAAADAAAAERDFDAASWAMVRKFGPGETVAIAHIHATVSR